MMTRKLSLFAMGALLFFFVQKSSALPLTKSSLKHFSDTSAPKSVAKKVRIGFLLPLYMDSIYDLTNDVFMTEDIIPLKHLYTYEFLLGLEYYFQTHNYTRQEKEVYIFDSRIFYDSSGDLCYDFLNKKHFDYIITTETGSSMQQLISFAKEYETVVISALDPSNYNTKNNPYFIMLFPTLLTHLEGLQKYAYQNTSLTSERIVTFINEEEDSTVMSNWMVDFINNRRRFGDIIWTYFKSPPGAINFVMTNLNKYFLPSPNINKVILGTYNSKMAYDFLKAFASIDTAAYKLEFVGMPMWSEDENISLIYFKKKPFAYTKGLYFSPQDPLMKKITYFLKDYFYVPSSETSFFAYAIMEDFFEKFEYTYWSFWQRLKNSKNEMKYFEITPINSLIRRESFISYLKNAPIDYYENKKIYLSSKNMSDFVSVKPLQQVLEEIAQKQTTLQSE